MKRFVQYSRFLAAPILCAAVVLTLTQCVFFIGYVPSASMEPAIPEKSWILGVRLYDELNIGDIVIFEHDQKVLVKRITAGPNDIVYASGMLVIIPEDCYFVEGDNKDNSLDSRYWENPFVHKGSILAQEVLP